MPSPEPDPIAALLYELLADHVPLGKLKDAVDLARTSHRVEPDDELTFIAERMAEELRTGEEVHLKLNVTRIAGPAETGLAEEPAELDASSRPAQVSDQICAKVLRWINAQGARSIRPGEVDVGVGIAKVTRSRAITRLADEGKIRVEGNRGGRRVFSLTPSEPDHDDAAEDGTTSDDAAGDTGDGDHDEGQAGSKAASPEHRGSGDDGRESGSAAAATTTAQGSTDTHAGSAENSPPRSPSDGGPDESPDGGEDDDDDEAGAGDSSPPDLVGHRPPPAPPIRDRSTSATVERTWDEEEEEDAEKLAAMGPGAPVMFARAKGSPPKRASIDKVLVEIEPWVLRQQTFRRRQLQEAFPHFDASEIRSALTAMGIRGTIQIATVQAGEPMYSVVSNADRGGEARPDPSSTGTVEGAVLSFVEARDGSTLLAVSNAVGVPQHEVAAVLSKLRSEGDVRWTTKAGERVYVRAA